MNDNGQRDVQDYMPGTRLTFARRMRFAGAGFLMLAVYALAVWFIPLRGQDDNSVAPTPDSVPPPSDIAAAAPDESTAASAPDDSASFQTFYDALGSQGTWIQSSDYGYVWQPQVSDPDWAPYTDGHWVYTDDGWTWASDEPWGWATYHYGRWVNIDGTGWVWVPGYTWAPAWVSWRYGDGYCGWAPLPPDSFVGIDYSDDGFDIGVGFHIGGDCDAFYGIGAGWYTFIPVTCLGYRHYHGYYCHRGDNFALINRTTNVTNINVARTSTNVGGAGHFGRVTTGGPALAQINAVSTSPIQKVNLVHAHQPGGGTLSSNSLALYAPNVEPGATAQPSRVAGSILQTRINRGTDITRPLAVNSTLAVTPASGAQIEQARMAQSQAPASAKVITDSTSIRPVLQAPLTSLKPMTTVSNRPIFNTAPTAVIPSQHAPGTSVFPPTARTYPEAGNVPSHVYYPGANSPSPAINPMHAPTSTTSGGSQSHSYVRPSAPSVSPPNSSGVHSSSSGSSGYSSGGASHASSSGAAASWHGGGSSQSH